MPLADQILEELLRRDPPAALVTEVATSIRPSPPPRDVEEALRMLEGAGRVVVAAHEAPDIHLVGIDLRVVAARPPGRDERAAADAAERYWHSWLRAFLSTHRCQ